MTPASPKTRQQRRYNARLEAKAFLQAQPRTKVQERMRRGAFKAARAMFAEIGAILKRFANQGAHITAALRELRPLRHRGKGRGTPMRRHSRGGNNGGAGVPHQAPQECLRRLVGGWAFRQRISGMTKRQTLEALAKRPPMPAIAARNLIDEGVHA